MEYIKLADKNIKEYCAQQLERIKGLVQQRTQAPRLVIIQVGHNDASDRYVRNKIKDCEQVGIRAEVAWVDEKEATQVYMETLVRRWAHMPIDGMIIQLPLPAGIDKDALAALIPDALDVDGFKNTSPYYPCTPKGIIDYLERAHNYSFDGKHVVVIGRSDIVGRPMASMALERDATVTVCHSHTRNLKEILQIADLVVCAVGKPKFLDVSELKCPVIDVGINYDNGLCGDCYGEGNVTPVPGGVGLLTRLALVENVIDIP